MNKVNKGMYDEEKVIQTINTIFKPGQVFEVRIIRNNRKGGISGYFKKAEDVIKAFDTVDLRNTNVYMTINEVDESCYDMAQQNRFIDGASTTQDTDIAGYRWLFIDLDPKRKSGISSTDEQQKAAFKIAGRVAKYLKNHNFSEPVKAISGNGAHLLYPIALRNTEENIELVKRCQEVLDKLFSDEVIEVDAGTFNPARVCKLYGTLAQKGANSPTRPHRMSYILSAPKEPLVTPKVNLMWLADQLPKEEERKPLQQPHTYEEFDIERWLSDHKIQYTKKSWKDGAEKYVLDECPFNGDHKAPDSCVIKQSSGAIGFKCLHNSCRNYTWKDLRLKYEPDAYDRPETQDREIEAGWQRHNQRMKEISVLDVKDELVGEPLFYTMSGIINLKEPENEYLSTGIPGIDITMKGLQKGSVSVLSGLRGSAKSTLLSQIMLNMINNGQTVVCYSGELSSKNFARWMLLQAAGNRHTVPLNRFRNSWIVDSMETQKRIAQWMDGKFWLYNNEYGNDSTKVIKLLEEQIKTVHADYVVLDNLMAVDLGNDNDKYEAQTKFVWTLKNLAKIHNVHVTFVAHPRKAGGFLRLNDISGTGNIGNIVDAAFIIHRNNNDFDKAITDHLGKRKYEFIPDDSCTNVIEICKDRENGTQDFYIPLWYEPETKRLRTRTDEYVVLGWETDAAKETWDDDDDPF